MFKVKRNTVYKRQEDMSPDGSLEIIVQQDGDVILTIFPEGYRKDPHNNRPASVEFCTPSAGGGKSPKTWDALRNLAQAMAEDSEAEGA